MLRRSVKTLVVASAAVLARDFAVASARGRVSPMPARHAPHASIASLAPIAPIAPIALIGTIASLACVPACVCHRATSDDGTTTTTTASANPSNGADAPGAIAWDLHLMHHALDAFGNTTPLPVSPEFDQPVPEVMPALEKAAGLRGVEPVRLRIERDVPYGQITRLMQAGIGARIARWQVISLGYDGATHAAIVRTPGGLPQGQCWMRAWVGPDDRVLIGGYGEKEGIADAGSNVLGTLVLPAVDHVDWEKVTQVVRRLDAGCTSGQLRVYAQPAGSWGGVFDLVVGFDDAQPPPHIREVLLQVPSLGPMDSTFEVIK